jgi:hypothetical protein
LAPAPKTFTDDSTCGCFCAWRGIPEKVAKMKYPIVEHERI